MYRYGKRMTCSSTITIIGFGLQQQVGRSRGKIMETLNPNPTSDTICNPNTKSNPRPRPCSYELLSRKKQAFFFWGGGAKIGRPNLKCHLLKYSPIFIFYPRFFFFFKSSGGWVKIKLKLHVSDTAVQVYMCFDLTRSLDK